MDSVVKFGDVFRHKEKDYVFLAKTDELVYAAQILSSQETSEVNGLSERRASSAGHNKYEDNKLFCFVILTTSDFENRMAHLAQTEQGNGLYFDIYARLCDEDLKSIKKEICHEKSSVSVLLKKIVSEVDV